MEPPSDRPLSRRHVLTGLAAVGTGELAGCASLTEREQPVRFCETSAPRAEDPTVDLIEEVAVNPGNPVVLSVALRQNASTFEAVGAVVVFDGTGERRFTLPATVKSGEPPASRINSRWGHTLRTVSSGSKRKIPTARRSTS